LLSPLPRPGDALAATYSYHPNTVVSLGATFDPVDLSKAYRRCLEYDFEYSIDATEPGAEPKPIDKIEYSGETSFSIAQVRSTRDLYSYLHISAAVSGHYGLFSGGASFELEDEKRFHEDSFSWVLKAETNYGRFGMHKPRLAEFAQRLARQNPAEFWGACGHEFVAQTNRAVLAAAVYTIRNMSQEARHRVEASFNASVGGGMWGVGGGGSYKEFMRTASSLGVIELNIYVVGGPGVTTLADVALDQNTSDITATKRLLVDYIKSQKVTASVPTRYTTGPLAAFVPSLANINFDHYLKTIEELYFLYQDVRGRAARVRDHVLKSGDYVASPGDIQKWTANLSTLDRIAESLVEAARKCRLYFHDLERMPLGGGGRADERCRGAAVDAAALSRYSDPGGEARSGADRCTPVVEACRVPDVSGLWSVDQPPQYPFDLEYEIVPAKDAAGNWYRNLVLRAAGPQLARMIVYEGTDQDSKLNSVFHATSAGDKKVAVGSIDVTTIGATKDWVRIEVAARSGRVYPVSVPLK
jgi:hypothetical protein